MSDRERLLAQIENAASIITQVWPVKNFIATNPLAGLEELPFKEAMIKGQALFGGSALPTRKMGQTALLEGKIDPEILKAVLAKYGVSNLYEDMVSGKSEAAQMPTKYAKLNALMIKYLAAFLDEGQAGWEMPGRQKGFYTCWHQLAQYDNELAHQKFISNLPDKSIEAALNLLADTPDERREEVLQLHLVALPGWSGFIKWRAEQKYYPWQKACPITLLDYLAVRLAMARIIGEEIVLGSSTPSLNEEGFFWLEAWEQTYQQSLINKLKDSRQHADFAVETIKPEAQLVFCIDVRSEVFRRHLEQIAPYETLGFAGFFGLPVRYKAFGSEIAVDSCPVLLHPQFDITEQPKCGQEKQAKQYLDGLKTSIGFKEIMQRIKNDLAAPFAMVEVLGAVFGFSIISKTFFPRWTVGLFDKVFNLLAPSTSFNLTVKQDKNDTSGMSLSARIFYAEAALRIMGLTKDFAPLVVFCGHGSQTINNPYAAGLDCGACGGNHGGPNARLIATILNEKEVREGLKEHQIEIPANTIFMAAEHNTTTDEVTLFDTELLPETQLKSLQDNLLQAKFAARNERYQQLSTKRLPDVRANDWAETRPEWGLARNAAFIVGPRMMSKKINLEGRSFLHSYNWESDHDGKILKIILTAPMVVAEWINSQYYFSTVDNYVYGSGSKITHNVVGKHGIMQGNGSDLMIGLPLQSVMLKDGEAYHEPLRLTTIIEAPLSRVTITIAENDILQRLFDNNWVSLIVLDPNTKKYYRYSMGGVWKEVDDEEHNSNTNLLIVQTKEFGIV